MVGFWRFYNSHPSKCKQEAVDRPVATLKKGEITLYPILIVGALLTFFPRQE